MLKGDAAFATRVEQAVAAIEARTDAEVVVVAAPRSGSYRDVAFAGASIVSFLALVLAVAAPFAFSPWALLLELVLVWAGSAWVLSSPTVLRWLLHPARRKRHVRAAALAEFHGEAVHATPRRIGVLVYASFLEQEVELVPDVGLEGLIPGGVWLEIRARFATHTLEGFVAGLEALGERLAQAVPASDTGPGAELSDAPRIRS